MRSRVAVPKRPLVALVILLAMLIATVAYSLASRPSQESTSLAAKTTTQAPSLASSSSSVISATSSSTYPNIIGGIPHSTSTSTFSTISYTYGPSNASFQNPYDGLSFQMSIGPTAGGNITVTVEEVNPRNSVDNVTQGNDWPYTGKGYLDPSSSIGLNPLGGCSASKPVGFAVFQGYFGLNNYTNGAGLSLHKPQALLCTITSGAPTPTYSFQPMSDNATESVSPKFPGQEETVSLTLSIGGYWTESSQFDAFGPGVFTVLGGDQWGDFVLLYFSVSSSGIISTGSAVVPG